MTAAIKHLSVKAFEVAARHDLVAPREDVKAREDFARHLKGLAALSVDDQREAVAFIASEWKKADARYNHRAITQMEDMTAQNWFSNRHAGLLLGVTRKLANHTKAQPDAVQAMRRATTYFPVLTEEVYRGLADTVENAPTITGNAAAVPAALRA